ncbi:MAG: site-2 protease family protein [Nitrososphaerota archaeon]
MTTWTGYSEQLDKIKMVVSRNFNVTDVYYEAGVLTFNISDSWIKERFKECVRQLKTIGMICTAKREGEWIKIRVYPYRTPPGNRFRLPLILAAVSLITVAADGYLRSAAPIFRLLPIPYGVSEVLFNSALFAGALFAIIFIHEMGHKISARLDGVSTSPPYFIPGLPGFIPTLGAVIFQKDPLTNRDDMFDIGVSGPLAGFVVCVAVTLAAFQTAVWVPVDQYVGIIRAVQAEGMVLEPPLLFRVVRILYGRPDDAPFFMTIGFAAWLGLVVTALNLLPIWQLDGGRIFRSFLTRRQHMAASYASIAILVASGYYFMAILILILMSRSVDITPLDEVSPLSMGRKLSIVGILSMLVLSFVPISRLF